MSKIELVTIENPFGKMDECGKITATERTSYYINGCIQEEPSKYTFQTWVKSADTSFSIQIGSCVHEFSLKANQWTRCIYTTPVEISSEQYSSMQMTFTTGVYYVYCTQLEIGTLPSDWDDVNDAKNYAISAQEWTDANGKSLLDLKSMVLKWTNGAMSDTTVINGGWIQTNTITADKIAIGDFTDYSNLNINTASVYGWEPYTDNTNNSWFRKATLSRDSYISKWYDCKGTESFRVKANIFTSVYGQTSSGGTATPVPLKIRIGLMLYDDKENMQWLFTEDSVTATSTSGNSGEINSTVSLPSNARSFRFFVQINGYTPFSGQLMVKDLVIRRMTDSELIVDGSITADKLSANNIYGSNGWINLKEGIFNYGNGKFVWDGSNLLIEGRVNATSGKIGDFFINDALYTIAKPAAKDELGTIQGNVYISNEGISLGTAFKVTKFGDLTATNVVLTGRITATEGSIGGFHITSTADTSAYTGHCFTNSLYRHSGDGTYEYEAGLRGSGTAASSTANGDGATNKAFYINRVTKGSNWSNPTSVFYVQNNGKLYASNAEIVGHITANEGKIGDFNISNALYTKAKSFATTADNIYFGSDGLSLGINFKVTSAGVLTATGANITGTLTATSGKIGDFFVNNALYTSSNSFGNVARNIYLGSNGLSLGTTFSVSDAGYLTCTNGKIAEWTINTNAIYRGNSNYANASGMYFGVQGLSISDKFKVGIDGALHATNATIEGNITATTLKATASGQISSWNFNADAIWRTSSNYANASGMYFGISGLSISNKFKVSKEGILTCTDANVTGTINATAGNIGGCSIVDGTLTVANGNIKNISADKITSGTIDGKYIKADSIAADKIHCTDLYTVSAKIGGWSLNSTSITANNGSTGLSSTLGTNNSGIAFWAGGNNFRVSHAGNVIMDGQCTAKDFRASGVMKLLLNNSPHDFASIVANGSGFMIKLGDEESDYSSIKYYSFGGTGEKNYLIIGNNEIKVAKDSISFAHTPTVNGTALEKTGHSHSGYATSSHTHDRLKNSSYGLKLGDGSSDKNAIYPTDANGNSTNGTSPLGTSSARFKAIYVSASAINSGSDRNIKHNISRFDERFEKAYMDFEPVKYMLRNFNEVDNHDRLHYGLIAQDVETALKNNGIANEEAGFLCVTKEEVPNQFGEMKSYSLCYMDLISLNMHMIQKLHKEVEELKKQLNDRAV